MSASDALRRARRPRALSLALIALLAVPAGCGGSAADRAGSASTNPKAAQRQRDMEAFMKNQKPQNAR